MKLLSYIILGLVLVGCVDEKPAGKLSKKTLPSGRTEFDSVLQISWSSEEGQDIMLYTVAGGGNLEYLCDTILQEKGEVRYAVMQLADYFQEGQLFYIVYDVLQNRLKQSPRLSLVDEGVMTFSALRASRINGDTLWLMEDGGRHIGCRLDTLVCGTDKVINYYEYE